MPCVFCLLVAGQAPAEVLYRDDLVTAFRDLRPRAPVHFLVVPNRHIHSAAELGDADAPVLARMFAVARQLAEQQGIQKSGYRLVFNVGADAGQSVDHLHLHVLGGRHLAWPPG
ncbi:MAG: histidine triad nucleotide-binding protein [Chloroflexota bacterium]